ncbi:MAG: DUF6542 domain-containing protein [Mycobacterium sp.]
MSAQRGSSAVEAGHRSIHPNIPGVPWWGAVLIATTSTAIGYIFDAGHKELTHVFAGFYIAGCVAAMLAVRRSGVFTAVIQPPLILFLAVPGAYWLFHGGKIGGIKDLLINCGYPLIERFPLMLGTAGGVLLIGLVRWYFGGSSRTAAATDEAATPVAERTSLIKGMAAKLKLLFGPDPDLDDDETPDTSSRPAHSVRRSRETGPKTARPRSSRSADRTTRTRSRHARPDDGPEAPPERRPSRRSPASARDFDPADPPRQSRRRPRPQGEPEPRPQRETRRDPRARRNPYERPYDRPEPRSSRFDPYDMFDAPESAAGPVNRRHGAYEPYEPFEPYEPPRHRTAPPGPGSANPSHHPISQVRYRGQPPVDEPRAEYRDELRPDRRNPRPRGPRRSQGRPPADSSWEYEA